MDELEQKSLETFSFLKGCGFPAVLIKRSSLTTVISYLGKRTGLQFEFEWREWNVSVLLVKLRDGELPGGYYESDGETVRVHLTEYLTMRGILHDQIKVIRERRKLKVTEDCGEFMKWQIQAYSDLIKKAVDVQPLLGAESLDLKKPLG